MSVLTKNDIVKRVADKNLGIKPFIEQAVQPASYDFHLGDAFLVFPEYDEGRNVFDLQYAVTNFKPQIVERTDFDLPPLSFVLGMTMEYFKFPNDVAGMVKAKSSIGRLGIQVSNGDAGWVDPGFTGKLVLELKNNNPRFSIKVRPGMPIGQIVFMTTTFDPADPKNVETYDGHYVDQNDFALKKWKLSLVRGQITAQNVFNKYILNDDWKEEDGESKGD